MGHMKIVGQYKDSLKQSNIHTCCSTDVTINNYNIKNHSIVLFDFSLTIYRFLLLSLYFQFLKVQVTQGLNKIIILYVKLFFYI